MTETIPDFILLVDDDAVGRSLRKLVLEKQGHRVLAVGDAGAALRTLQDERIGLIILDYFLSGVTGAELAKQMRGLKPSVPILLLSASSEKPEDIDQVDGYLCKLDPIVTIEEKINALLRDRRDGKWREPGAAPGKTQESASQR